MDGEISALEAKLEHFLAHYDKVCGENRALRAQVAALESDKQALTEKIHAARGRLEALMDRLPEQ